MNSFLRCAKSGLLAMAGLVGWILAVGLALVALRLWREAGAASGAMIADLGWTLALVTGGLVAVWWTVRRCAMGAGKWPTLVMMGIVGLPTLGGLILIWADWRSIYVLDGLAWSMIGAAALAGCISARNAKNRGECFQSNPEGVRQIM